jgi:hypothetical protein
VSLLADDNVIVHGNTEWLRHRDDLLCHLHIGVGRRRIPRRVIVQKVTVAFILLILLQLLVPKPD